MKNSTSTTKLTALLLLSFFASACQRQEIHPSESSSEMQGNFRSYTPNFTLAKTSKEMEALRLNSEANIVRTPKDFDFAFGAANSPIARLPKEVQKEFKKHVFFREGIGIAVINYANIKPLLIYDELARALALFGIDAKNGYWGLSQDPAIIQQLAHGGSRYAPIQPGSGGDTDYEGYYCFSPHTCKAEAKSICMSACDKDK